jgi:hypothetical protein
MEAALGFKMIEGGQLVQTAARLLECAA